MPQSIFIFAVSQCLGLWFSISTFAQSSLWPHLAEPIVYGSPERAHEWNVLDLSPDIGPGRWYHVDPDAFALRFRNQSLGRLMDVDEYIESIFPRNGERSIRPLNQRGRRSSLGGEFLQWVSAAFDLTFALRVKGRLSDLDLMRARALNEIIENRLKDKNFTSLISQEKVLRALVFNLMAQNFSSPPEVSRLLLQPFYNNRLFWNRARIQYAVAQLSPRGMRAVVFPAPSLWRPTQKSLPDEIVEKIRQDLGEVRDWVAVQTHNDVAVEGFYSRFRLLESSLLTLGRAVALGYRIPNDSILRQLIEELSKFEEKILLWSRKLQASRRQHSLSVGDSPAGDEIDVASMRFDDPPRFKSFNKNFPLMLRALSAREDSRCRARVVEVRNNSR